MLCQECGNKPATVHLTKIVNNNKEEYHLCAECARKKEGFEPIQQPELSFHHLLTGLFKDFDLQSPSLTYRRQEECPACQLDFGSFTKEGFLGCSECYQTFEKRLEPLLKKVHGHREHVGKVPRKAGGRLRVKKEIQDLNQKLEAAVEREEYEEAAELRDKIRELEKRLQEN